MKTGLVKVLDLEIMPPTPRPTSSRFFKTNQRDGPPRIRPTCDGSQTLGGVINSHSCPAEQTATKAATEDDPKFRPQVRSTHIYLGTKKTLIIRMDRSPTITGSPHSARASRRVTAASAAAEAGAGARHVEQASARKSYRHSRQYIGKGMYSTGAYNGKGVYRRSTMEWACIGAAQWKGYTRICTNEVQHGRCTDAEHWKGYHRSIKEGAPTKHHEKGRCRRSTMERVHTGTMPWKGYVQAQYNGKGVYRRSTMERVCASAVQWKGYIPAQYNGKGMHKRSTMERVCIGAVQWKGYVPEQ